VIILKKIKYLIITCLSIAMLSYGVIAFANGGTNADSKVLSQGDVTGSFVSMVEGDSKIKLNLVSGVETYPLDKSIWVFLDQKKTALVNLKSGDKIVLILNSSKKVTYIKAFSEAYLKAKVAIVLATPTPSPTLTPTPTPTAAPTEIKKITLVKEDKQAVVEKKELKDDENDDDLNVDINVSNNDDGNDNQHGNKHDNKGEKD
jgi:hypothetical protein